MDFFNVLEQRYSVRSYRPDPVEAEKLEQIMEAARLAPTACNRQAFKIIVISTKGRQNELKKIYPKDWFGEAPNVLCVCSTPGENWVRKDGKNYSDVDAAIVMDHMILAATALGLGTCWIGAFDPEAARNVLGLGDSMEPVAFTPLGYSKGLAPDKSRKPVGELVIRFKD